MKTLKTMRLLALASFGIMVSAACSPKVYVIDRQTVLEEEAAGHWPQFEKDVLAGAKSAGPVPFPKTPPSPRRARLYNVLNGQVISSSAKE